MGTMLCAAVDLQRLGDPTLAVGLPVVKTSVVELPAVSDTIVREAL